MSICDEMNHDILISERYLADSEQRVRNRQTETRHETDASLPEIGHVTEYGRSENHLTKTCLIGLCAELEKAAHSTRGACGHF